MAKIKIDCDDSCCAVYVEKDGDTVDVVDAEFARGLERENDLLMAVNNDVKRIAMERNTAEDENKRLKEWIKEEGIRSNTCTYHVLGRTICENCECSRKEKK